MTLPGAVPDAISDGLLEEAAHRFGLLADPTRLRIVHAILERGEAGTAELSGALGLAAPNVSQHLSRLLAGGLLSRRRDGKSVRYQVADPTLPALCDLVCSALRREARVAERPRVVK